MCVLLFWHCGNPGEAPQRKAGITGELSDVLGSITNQFGGQAKMAGWNVVLVEKHTGIAKIGMVDSAGLFTLKNAKVDTEHTIVLLTPNLIINSVLSAPSHSPTHIRQFFRLNSVYLPQLITRGEIVTFQNEDTITMTNDIAGDQNGDLIPDGSVSVNGLGLNLLLAAPDTDGDGIINDLDPDIDADGIINWFDPDDDGDTLLDLIDGDANGDNINDQNQVSGAAARGDFFFNEGVEYIAVRFEMEPKSDGSGNKTSMAFVTKVREDIGPQAVQVRGPDSLLNGAVVETVDDAGNPTTVKWDKGLLDDGKSEDSSAGDRIFGKKVVLADGKIPQAHTAFFIELAFGSGENTWYMDFPYAFPDLAPAMITSSYEPNTRTVRLVGNPFGVIQDFVWAITLLNSDGTSVWQSSPVIGTERVFTIPANVIEPNQSYTYEVVASVLEKVPGQAAFTIRSQRYSLSTTTQ